MTDSTLSSVNEHCLDNVMKLAESSKVTASEDIFDANGTKLLAKGAKFTPALKERLVRHKLRRPLETTLTIDDGITVEKILAEARQVLKEVSALKVFVGDKQGFVFDTLSSITLHPVAAMLLTVADKSREGAFRHGVLVALIAVSLGAHKKLSSADRQLLALAGMLHDIGELYIQPEYLHTQRALTPQEWKHVAAHPRIGQMVLDELTDYPKEVINAVGEHHERIDGSGYPRQLSGQKIGPLAQILSIAEKLSGIIERKDDVLVRSCLALKCIPGEHPHSLVSVVSSLRRNYDGEPFPAGAPAAHAMPKTQEVARALASAIAECDCIAKTPSLPAAASNLLLHAKDRLSALRLALKATGVEECLADDQIAAFTQDDHEIFLEIEVVGQELGWRLRDIGRDLYLRCSDLIPDAAPTFSKLIGILDLPAS